MPLDSTILICTFKMRRQKAIRRENRNSCLDKDIVEALFLLKIYSPVSSFMLLKKKNQGGVMKNSTGFEHFRCWEE